MTVDMSEAIAHMNYFYTQNIRYSQNGSRDGSDGTADCSGAVYSSINYAGGTYASSVPTTDTLHNYLLINGFVCIKEGNNIYGAKRGDVFIWGIKGQSSGDNGHTGIFLDSNRIISMNPSGITTESYNDAWVYDNRPYSYLYRLKNSTPVAPPVTVDRSVISIYYVPGYGVKAINGNGTQISGSENVLKHGTKWHATGVYMLNGKPAYAIGSDLPGWYVYQAYTNQCNSIKINYTPGYGVNAVDSNGNTLLGTNRTFKTDTAWHIYLSEATIINGSVHYKVGNNEYIPSYYTYGGGFR